MSDFDKFFAKKLNEESQFPNKDKNWRTLSKRLDAFDAGATGTNSYLRYWQVAASAAVLTIVWLACKVTTVQNENIKLRREVVVLQEKNKAAEQEVAQAHKLRTEAGTGVTTVGETRTWGKDAIAAEGVFVEEKKQKYGAAKSSYDKNNDRQHLAGAATERPGGSEANTSSPEVNEEKVAAGGAPYRLDTLTAPETDFTKLPNLPLLPADSIINTVIASQVKFTPKRLPLPQPEDTTSTAASKIIEPARSPSRFRMGVQVLAGTALPREKGVSPITGQGLTAEFALWRGLSVMALADWLRFDVATDEYHPRFHSNNPDNAPPPPPFPASFHKLKKVECSQRQQHYGVGIKYALPVQFWLRPSVRITHTWVRVSPDLLSFKYEKKTFFPPHGPFPLPPPKYIVTQGEARQLDNIWRFGAGLEYETQRWSFGLWADYSTNLAASDATFDALLLRAGVQYKFN